jgi:response regulator RpfG family c-di-GMP phosphodiesterase
MISGMIRWFNDRKNAKLDDRYCEQLLESLYRMAMLVEARDPYTGGHLWRVSQFSQKTAEYLGLPIAEIAAVTLGAFLHDLGKVSIPDSILNKKDRLTDQEFAVIKTHPEMGAKLIAGHPLYALIKDAVLLHHEMVNGKGYPHGYVQDQIPLSAKIVGIADAFDAMTSTRPYRKGMSIPEALAIIEQNLGSQFDEKIGKKFIELGKAGAFNDIAGHSESGIPLQVCPACGPTIVISKDQQTGDLVYCRCCSTEAKISSTHPVIQIQTTGKQGGPSALAPTIDHRLLKEIIANHVAML